MFADAEEARLARDNAPEYRRATLTSIAEAVTARGATPLAPMGTAAASFGSMLGGLVGGMGSDRPPASTHSDVSFPLPSLIFAVQPGDGGPMEDWLNIEILGGIDDAPIVVLNGGLDKLRTGYYPRLLFPKLYDSVDRFWAGFEEAFYLRPLSGSGWLFRVYPEPWQLFRQTREELVLLETYEARPALAGLTERLRRP